MYGNCLLNENENEWRSNFLDKYENQILVII